MCVTLVDVSQSYNISSYFADGRGFLPERKDVLFLHAVREDSQLAIIKLCFFFIRCFKEESYSASA